MPKYGKYSLLSLKRDDDHCRGFVGSSRDLICVNKNCKILAHSKPSSKWVQQERVVFLLPAVKAAKSRTAFVLSDALLSGDDLPTKILLATSKDQKTPRQWIADFMPYACIRAAEMGRLEEEEEDEDESLTEYQFGMDFEPLDGPTAIEWDPIPNVVYPSFLAEEAVRQMGDDGLYAAEMREAITGVRGRLSDAQQMARADLLTLAEYVYWSTGWVMEHVSFLQRCGDHLQAAVGDVPSLASRFPYPTLAGSVHELLG
jgi:hypothetical protein